MKNFPIDRNKKSLVSVFDNSKIQGLKLCPAFKSQKVN